MVTIAGFEVTALHMVGALAAATTSVLGLGIGTGRIQFKDLLNFNFSPNKGAKKHAQDAKDAMPDAPPLSAVEDLTDKQENAINAIMEDYFQQIARELDHFMRTAYVEGKREGEMQASNEDKHFKVSVVAMLSASLAVLLQLATYFGVL